MPIFFHRVLFFKNRLFGLGYAGFFLLWPLQSRSENISKKLFIQQSKFVSFCGIFSLELTIPQNLEKPTQSKLQRAVFVKQVGFNLARKKNGKRSNGTTYTCDYG